VDCSIECRTIRSIQRAVSRFSVIKSMIAARFASSSTAAENSAQPASSNGYPLAETGLTATSDRTRLPVAVEHLRERPPAGGGGEPAVQAQHE
jgi:hypothetical protein